MKSLDELVEARREEMVRDLQNLMAIESVKGPSLPGAPFGTEVRAALDFVLEKGRALGLSGKSIDGYAGHLEFGSGEELVGVLVHVDVVPAGEGWLHPPFAGQIADGRLFGRGASDDKGPTIACLHALAALQESGFEPCRRIRLILGCDEETGWACVSRYFATEERPIHGFSPDGQFPVIVAEKGILSLDLSRQWARQGSAPVSILAVQGGTRPNVVPESCRAAIALHGANPHQIREALAGAGVPLDIAETPDHLLVAAEGKPAHGSLPEQGVNAVGRLFLGLREVSDWLPPEQAEVVRFLSEGIGLAYDGSGLGLAASDAVSGPLTVNLGAVHWDEGMVRIQLDVRYPVTMERDFIYGRLRESAAAFGLESAVSIELPPHHIPADHPLVTRLMAVFAEKTATTTRPLAIGGRTYACALGTGVAFGPTFPGKPEVAHQRDEYIELDEFLLAARIYAAAMAALIRP